MLALNLIDEPRLAKVEKVRDLASIAKDLAAVIRTTTPQTQDNSQRAQFIFFSPRLNTEDIYESTTIQVSNENDPKESSTRV
jgi:hypothetical protein